MQAGCVVVDIGNSSTKIALFRGGDVDKVWSVPTDAQALLAWAADLPPDLRGLPAVVGSVVPPVTTIFAEELRRGTGAEVTVLDGSTPLPIAVRYEGTPGIDRIANVVAAKELVGEPAIVVDVGSCITMDVLSGDGAFVGGAILPGPVMMAGAMARGTGQLPRVELVSPDRAVGASTTAAMQSGVVVGAAGAVEKLIAETRQELGGNPPAIFTGGQFELLRAWVSRSVRYEPHLTLEGLRLIYEWGLRRG